MKAKKAASFKIPPHANAAVHRKVMAELKRMTPEERVQTLIDAGILTKTRRLARAYRQPSEPKSRPAR